MAENSEPSTSGLKRPLRDVPREQQSNKILRLNSPSFENELNSILLASDDSDNEEEVEDLLVDEAEFRQRHPEYDEQDQIEEELPSDSENVMIEHSSSESSEDDVPLSELSTPNYYYGKNRYKWAKTPPSSRVRTPHHNIVLRTSTSRLTVMNSYEAYDIWNQLFDEDMRQTILRWTNVKIAYYRERYKRQNKPELKDLDLIELNAFLGLLFYSAVLKSNHENTSFIFAMDGTGCEIYRCCMSETRFLILQLCLRFDNPADRAERQKADKVAAISEIFEKFVANSQKLYEPSENITVDEMLVKFRGRSHLISYMPKKPGKYGMIIRAMCDSKTFYFYNGYLYAGKGSDGTGLTANEKKYLVPTQCVLRLTQPIQGTNRNITADNWFSSVELVDELAKRKLTYVGTVKKNKREIPIEFLPHKNRQECSTLFGFTGQKTLCSYVPKPNKAVLLISSMHHDDKIDNVSKKPEMILYYNSTKGGVDETDKKCSIYCSSRRTRRWPMVIFFRILDLSGVNAHILYNKHQNKDIDRGIFLKKLARSLVVPHMQRRYTSNKNLPRELKLTMKRILGKDVPPDDEPTPEENQNKKKRCYICPSRLQRKTSYSCVACKKPICLQCSNPLCKECQI